jgi:hypothetical protein
MIFLVLNFITNKPPTIINNIGKYNFQLSDLLNKTELNNEPLKKKDIVSKNIFNFFIFFIF